LHGRVGAGELVVAHTADSRMGLDHVGARTKGIGRHKRPAALTTELLVGPDLGHPARIVILSQQWGVGPEFLPSSLGKGDQLIQILACATVALDEFVSRDHGAPLEPRCQHRMACTAIAIVAQLMLYTARVSSLVGWRSIAQMFGICKRSSRQRSKEWHDPRSSASTHAIGIGLRSLQICRSQSGATPNMLSTQRMCDTGLGL
jgi:hypothetical protein